MPVAAVAAHPVQPAAAAPEGASIDGVWPQAITKNTPGRLLLIAPHSSYRIVPYLQAAARLNVDVLVASTSEHSLTSAVAQGLRIDLQNPQQALALIKAAHHQQPFSGIIGSDDGAVELTAHAAKMLDLPHNPPAASHLTRRKDLARQCLRDAGLPVPDFRRLDLHQDLPAQIDKLAYPCVVKPIALSGSRGVIRANNADELLAACARIRAIVADQPDAEVRRFALVEDYLPGAEVALEGMLHRGDRGLELEVLALFDKPEPLQGPYFEESYYVTPSRHTAATQALIARRTREACAAYGLRHGPIHAELRLHDNEAWIVEIAARTIGGQCARLLQYGTGQGLEELVIAQAVGRQRPQPAATDAAGVLMIPIPQGGILRRIEGLADARRVAHITDITISVRDGYELVPLPEGEAYLGFIFAQAASPAEVETALRTAHDCLRIITAPVWRPAIDATDMQT